MSTLDDVKRLTESTYGVRAVHARFSAENTTQFCNAEREWLGMRDTCDEIIGKKKLNLDDVPTNRFHLPVIFHFRKAFAALLETMPSTADGCMKAAGNLLTTLQTIQSLHEIVPFEDTVIDEGLRKRIRMSGPKDANLTIGNPSMVGLEERVIADWNVRREVKNERLLDPWSREMYASLLHSRDDISTQRFHPNGQTETLGHFFTRADRNDRDHYELLDFAAQKNTGMNDIVVVAMLYDMNVTHRTKLTNVMADHHVRI